MLELFIMRLFVKILFERTIVDWTVNWGGYLAVCWMVFWIVCWTVGCVVTKFDLIETYRSTKDGNMVEHLRTDQEAKNTITHLVF